MWTDYNVSTMFVTDPDEAIPQAIPPQYMNFRGTILKDATQVPLEVWITEFGLSDSIYMKYLWMHPGKQEI